MRALVEKTVTFDAAHRLPNYEGKCANLHGHHWVVKIGVEGEVNPETGMVVDFTILKEFLSTRVFDVFDHKFINDTIKIPTAENIAKFIARRYSVFSWRKCRSVNLQYVRVWETEDSMAEVRGDV